MVKILEKRLSIAVKETLDAETAIYIDLTRKSDLLLDESIVKDVTEEDTSLPTYIMSRFDYISELKKDPRPQHKKALKLLRSSDQETNRTSAIARYCKKNGIDLDRFLKLIVGFVMENFEEIDRAAVLDYMWKKFDQIKKTNKDNMGKMPDFAQFQMRLANSVIKFVNALTRLQLRKKSNKEVVDKAYHLLARKLDFLKGINRQLFVPQYRTTGKEAFARWLCDTYGSKKFAPEKAISRYKKEKYPCGKRKDRTIRIWIEEIAEMEEQGRWKIKKDVLEKYSEV